MHKYEETKVFEVQGLVIPEDLEDWQILAIQKITGEKPRKLTYGVTVTGNIEFQEILEVKLTPSDNDPCLKWTAARGRNDLIRVLEGPLTQKQVMMRGKRGYLSPKAVLAIRNGDLMTLAYETRAGEEVRGITGTYAIVLNLMKEMFPRLLGRAIRCTHDLAEIVWEASKPGKEDSELPAGYELEIKEYIESDPEFRIFTSKNLDTAISSKLVPWDETLCN